MANSLFKFILTFTIFVSLFSCSIAPDPAVTLDKSVTSYERAVRWGEFVRAKSFHKNDSELSDLERRRLKFYRVTGYTTLQNSTPDPHNAYLTVEIKYYKNDQLVIKSVTVKQHWKRDKKSTLWYLDSPFPKFR